MYAAYTINKTEGSTVIKKNVKEPRRHWPVRFRDRIMS